MILADKIVRERRKLNLSQEELAEQLSVSRQAVSKWESAQSVPDLQKILALSRLFSVSTDYLLKDEVEAETPARGKEDFPEGVRRVDMEEANRFLDAMEKQSRIVAFAVVLCILSPVVLILLAGLREYGGLALSESAAAGAGLAVLIVSIAAAVNLFVRNGAETEHLNYLVKEPFETAYGVTGFVREAAAAYKPVYTRFLSLGITLCVLSPLPLVLFALMKDSELLSVVMTAVLLGIAALGVYMIVRVSTVMAGYRILLREGEYGKKRTRNR